MSLFVDIEEKRTIFVTEGKDQKVVSKFVDDLISHNGSAEQKKNRASRNAARRAAEKAGKVRKGDGRDVDHKNMNPKDNRKSNLQVMDKSKNRAKNQWAKKKR